MEGLKVIQQELHHTGGQIKNERSHMRWHSLAKGELCSIGSHVWGSGNYGKQMFYFYPQRGIHTCCHHRVDAGDEEGAISLQDGVFCTIFVDEFSALI